MSRNVHVVVGVASAAEAGVTPTRLNASPDARVRANRAARRGDFMEFLPELAPRVITGAPPWLPVVRNPVQPRESSCFAESPELPESLSSADVFFFQTGTELGQATAPGGADGAAG